MNDLIKQITTAIDALPGWCTAEKAIWIARWIVTEKPNILVEIGVFGGRSMIAMGLAAEHNNRVDPTANSLVFAFDPYTTSDAIEGVNEPEHVDWWTRQQLVPVEQSARDAIYRLGLDRTVDLICERSDQGYKMFSQNTVGFLHIDGNHSQEKSTEDVELWLPLVEPGGAILLDDVDWPTVQRAREILRDECCVIHSNGKWEVFQKPRAAVLIV